MNHPPTPTTGGLLVIGSAAAADTPGAGLSTVRHDAAGALSLLGTLPVDRPSYAALDPARAVLHAVLEQESGHIASVRIDPRTGSLGVPATTPSGGSGPCHLAVHPGGSHLFAAHYGDGVLAVIPVGAEDALAAAEPSQTVHHPGREASGELHTSPRAHMAAPSPDGRFLLCTDLGTDRVHVYTFDPATGRLGAHDTVRLPDGRGPRHLVFHPSARRVHILNELASTLTVCTWDALTGRLEPTAELGTRRNPAAPNANSAAALRVSSDGRFLYTTNRGDDTITVFALHDDGAAVEPVDITACGGSWPRDIALSRDERHLFCANQGSDSLTAFHRDPDSGRLAPAGEPLRITEPTSVLPIVLPIGP
ncbi:lactonase family protein [Streptomyces sp. NRRL WC-3742]|uniref:lactonase family protein n=1 Tax=Streptomyces sp. NRRL WC-3742 TaxID=1463934 RepID=UPI00068C9302|nr:lactonase family protein [Streptomyces sp. NRRL WC-3742]